MEMIWESSRKRYSRMFLSHDLITLRKGGITWRREDMESCACVREEGRKDVKLVDWWTNLYLWEIRNRLYPKALENESKCLNGHCMMLGEGVVFEDPHE